MLASWLPGWRTAVGTYPEGPLCAVSLSAEVWWRYGCGKGAEPWVAPSGDTPASWGLTGQGFAEASGVLHKEAGNLSFKWGLGTGMKEVSQPTG